MKPKKPRFLPALHSPTAVFSPCQTWRYVLARTWNPNLPRLVTIGLNPSVADESQDDNTLRRCISFAKDWGFGTHVMLNMFGYRSTDPRGLNSVSDPNGPDNDRWISTEVAKADMVIVAWGANRHTFARAPTVLGMIPEPYCLGTTKGGSPKHPLYVVGSQEPVPFLWPQS